MNARTFYWPSLILAVALPAFTARAETGTSSNVSWEVGAKASVVGESDFKGWSKRGDAEMLETSFSAVASFEAGSGMIYRFGFELQRSDFGGVGAIPLPDSLQSYGLIAGIDAQLGDAWLARIEIRPGFYGGGDGDGDVFRFGSLNVPVVLGASYFVNSDLQFVLGVSLNFNRKYPVLPGVGVRWRMGHSWVLNGILPTPRIEYSLSPAVTLYAGGDFRSETFRMSRGYGRSLGSSRLDNAVADHTEIRVGAGVAWNINASTTFQMEAGVVPVHDVDYHRADLRMHSSDLPPYLDISLKTKF
jgi:hypothetical protein